MNFKKVFLYELFIGILVAGLTMYLFFNSTSPIVLYIGNLLLSTLLFVYVLKTHRKKKGQDEKEWLLLNKAWKGAGFVVTLFMLISFFFLQNTLTSAGDKFIYYFGFHWFSLFLIVHSILGFFLLNASSDRSKKSAVNEIVDKMLFVPDSFVVLRYSLFIGQIFAGVLLFFLSVSRYSNADPGRSISLPITIITIMPVQYFISTKYQKKRKMDERERHILYKITSVAALLSLLSFIILFSIKDFSLFSYLISDIWGLILVPLFLVIWGITGVIVFVKEEGFLAGIFQKNKI
jgi:hypothetical protein